MNPYLLERSLEAAPGVVSDNATVALNRSVEGMVRRKTPYPWLFPPPAGKTVKKIGGIVTPAAGVLLSVVTSYQVPEGHDAVIVGVFHTYVGSGFVQASPGSLLWYVRVDAAVLPDFDAMSYDLGAISTPWPVPSGIRLESGQLVEYLVSVPGGSPITTGGNNRNLAGLIGWEWPQLGSEEY